MRPAKNDEVIDKNWLEFGKGVVMRSTKKRVRVLFTSGIKEYDPRYFSNLEITRTAAERMKALEDAYQRFKKGEIK
jgi:hypothetical protein